MLLYGIIFGLIFITIFIIGLLCLFYKNLILDNLYLIIPAICIGIWALLALFNEEYHTPLTWDFQVFHESGLQIYKNPAHLYEVDGYVYTPSFAIFFAITFSLLPVDIAAYSFFILSYILGILTIIEYNKILILMDVKQKLHRFMFLIIISNGFFVLYQFKFNQAKYLLFVILVFIIRRELQFNKEEKEKDLKYYLINYGLFVFAIGSAPYFIFLLIIYMFQNIPRNEFFKQENVKKYVIVVMMFIIQNFLFIIYPLQIFDFLDGFNHPQRRHRKLKLIYLKEFMGVSSDVIAFLSILCTIILSIITGILLYKANIKIEEKFGYFSIVYIFIGVFAYTLLLSLILFSFILLLFVPYLNQNRKGIEFVKSNKYSLIGILSILGIFFASSDFIIYDFIPFLQDYPFIFLYYARWIFLLCVMIISLIILYLKNQDNRSSLN